MGDLDGDRDRDLELSSMPLFAGGGVDDIRAVSTRMTERTIAPGEVLMRRGEPGDFFALIVSGTATVSRDDHPGAAPLATVGSGSVLGEFALLRHRPRIATVTAVEPLRALTGDAGAFEALLELPGVHDRIQDIVSSRLAEGADPVFTTLPDGTEVLLRPLLHRDRPLLAKALDGFSAESLRSRFFAAGRPSERLIDYLTNINYVDHFSWVVAPRDDPGEGMAIARYIRLLETHDEAEVAFGVSDAHHGRGLGTLLLGALGAAATTTDIERFSASVLDDNKAMRTVLKKAGAMFKMREPGVVETTFPTAAAAGLLDEHLRLELQRASREIVTAAGLALTHPVD